MIIAIDYDDCYSEDPPLWDRFIDDAFMSGHRVVMVTCRRNTPENRDECRVRRIPAYEHYFTGLSPKRWFMETQQLIKVDVWIDDLPESVKEGR